MCIQFLFAVEQKKIHKENIAQTQTQCIHTNTHTDIQYHSYTHIPDTICEKNEEEIEKNYKVSDAFKDTKHFS